MDRLPDSCQAQHEKIAVMAENIKWIKENIEEMKKDKLAIRMKAVEEKQKTHTKAIGYGITVLTGILIVLVRMAWSMS